jgi:hypothetical protein
MPSSVFDFALAGGAELPPPDAPDHVLIRWLRQHLGRLPSWFARSGRS